MNPYITCVRLRGCAAYVIRQRGAVLVDAGLIGDGARLVGKLAESDLLRGLTLALVTHGHADHTGGLAAVRRGGSEEVKIAAHVAAAPFVEAGRNAPCRPVTILGHLARPLISLVPRSPRSEVDVAISEETDLAPYGVDGSIVPTPGHTLGCISVVLPNGNAFVGDLLMTAFGRGAAPRLPLFTEDVSLWVKSVADLLSRGGETFYAGHGGPFSAQQVSRLLKHVTRTAADLGRGRPA